MLDANGVRALISEYYEYTAKDLDADVTRGRFDWVFNIALDPKGRRELRFFKDAVEQRLKLLHQPKWVVRKFTFDEVLHALFPRRHRRKPWVSTPDVQLAFVCEHGLILDLARADELERLPGNDISRGRGNATQITWESVTRFLQERRIQ
jgi:hypothetical protein